MPRFVGHIDSPSAGSQHYPQRIPVAGWAFEADAIGSPIQRIAAYFGGRIIGETALFLPRPDVAQALGLAADVATGFRFLASLDAFEANEAEIEVRAIYADGSIRAMGAPRIVLRRGHLDAPYGHLCDPTHVDVVYRHEVFSTGNPNQHPNPDCLSLLADYLPPRATVFDVGCGIGAYAHALRQRGFNWTGCELDRRCITQLALAGLPHRQVRKPLLPWLSVRLPATDGEFDATIAVEVMEHTHRPDLFAAEMRRVTRQRALFSVPNIELLPQLSDQLVAPWHILEQDHWSFFTRFSLHRLLSRYFRRVEVIDYGEHPLRSKDGIPLFYHLFAICDV